jgi:hypothetical protein
MSMQARPLTLFLAALAAVVIGLATVAVIQSRLDATVNVDLEGDWLLTHVVQWGPYKGWTFRYRLHLERTDGALRGGGETLSVNGHQPGPRERTTLDVVRTLRDRGTLTAWLFERNGERAGRGAIQWRLSDPNRLVGTFRTTFYRGASVAQRIEAQGLETQLEAPQANARRAQSSPVATGRSSDRIHSLQEPG